MSRIMAHIMRPISNHITRRGFAVAATTATKTTDTMIIGGGPIGLSLAYHLSLLHPNNNANITIVERDPTYARASAVLSAGGIRQQFSLRENIEMSLYGKTFLRNASELLRVDDEDVDVQFQEHGYLFLAATNEGKDHLIRNNQLQQSLGADIDLLSPSQLKEKFPWLNTDDILLGSFGKSGEGWFDPWSLLRGLKRKCQSMGVNFVKGNPVQSVRDYQSGGCITAVDVMQYEREEGQKVTCRYNVKNVVNAAGAHCQEVMNILAGEVGLQYPIPVEPRKRCIFFFHCQSQQSPEHIVPKIAPLTICPKTNVYFRSEGVSLNDGEATGNFLCGVSPSEKVDKPIQDIGELDYPDHELFEEIIWPALYNRVPAFGELKLKSSWAGLYEYNIIDQNAIIDFHPEIPNVLMLNGFSGHGLQQSPATGRAGAELINYGRFTSLDLDIFSFKRCYGKDEPPVFELGIV